MTLEQGTITTIEGRQITPELKELLNPSKTALLVVDVQASYCDPNEVLPKLVGSDTNDLQAMVPRINEFIDGSRNSGVEVIWTRMIEDPEYMSENLKRKMEIDDTPALSTPDTPGFEYYGVKPEEGEHEVTKKDYSAFVDTDLDEYLKQKGIATLVVVGAYASRCVLATVTDAANSRHKYNVFVPKGLVGVLAKDAHELQPTYSIIDSIYGYIVKPTDILTTWQNENLELPK